MKSRVCVLGALAGALACAGASAETLFVIDQLVVSVSSTADDAGERVASLHSGESVEVLDHHDAYAHVRLASGTQGWVKASYLSSQLPLQRQLAEQSEELSRLKLENSQLQDRIGAAAATARVRARAPAAASLPAADTVRAAHPLWQWVLGFAAFGLIGGFALGWRMLDRRIRRKYGGLRIY